LIIGVASERGDGDILQYPRSPVVHSPLVTLGNHTVLPRQPYNEPCCGHVPDGRG